MAVKSKVVDNQISASLISGGIAKNPARYQKQNLKVWFWWSILKIVRTHFAPPRRGEGLAKNSACLPEAFGEGRNRNPEL